MLQGDPQLDRELRAQNRRYPFWRRLLVFAVVGVTALVILLVVTETAATRSADEGAVAAGAFSPVGSLSVARNGHAATLLDDGRVLIAGGGREDAPRTAEAWDAATEAFEPAGSLVERRKAHTATLLRDGRVLLVGGDRATPESEVWDPASASSAATGPLGVGRNGHTATLLDDGRVLVVGGWKRPGWLDSAEVWDPATGSFESTGQLAQARMSHTATLLPDGRVLVVGGHGADRYVVDAAGNLRYPDEPRALAEVFDPATGEFTPAGTLAQARSQHAAALLPDGRVLVVGGWGLDGPSMAEVWDPASMSFSPAGWPTGGGETATTLPDGRVLVVNGTFAELWDPAYGSFIPAGSLAQTRLPHTATLLPDGRVLVVGGRGRGVSSSAEVWTPRPLAEEQLRDLAESSSLCGELRDAFRHEGTTGDAQRDEEYLTRCLTCDELISLVQFPRIADLWLGTNVYRERCDPSFPLLPTPAPSLSD